MSRPDVKTVRTDKEMITHLTLLRAKEECNLKLILICSEETSHYKSIGIHLFVHMILKIKVLALTVLFWEVCATISKDEFQNGYEEKGKCYTPGSNLNAKYDIGYDKFPVNVSTAVQYNCTMETKMLLLPNENNTRICQSNGSWSNNLPICVHSLTEGFNNTVVLIYNNKQNRTCSLSTISECTFNNSVTLHIYLSGPATVDAFEVEGTQGLDFKFGENKQPEVDQSNFTKVIVNKNRTRIMFSAPVKIDSFMEIKVHKSQCINCRITDLNIMSQRGHSKSWCPKLNNITKVLPAGDICIHFAGNDIKSNATDAVGLCKTSDINGTLIGPINENIQLLLQNNVNKTVMRYWIGLRKQDSSNWEWVNGEKLNNTSFWVMNDNKKKEEKKEQENCVSLLKTENFRWAQKSCAKKNKWICQTGYLSCGLPDAKPITMMRSINHNRNFPIEISYYCPEGFTLNGTKIRECQHNGQWSDKAPICEKNITNSDTTDRTKLDDSMTNSADDNYLASNDTTDKTKLNDSMTNNTNDNDLASNVYIMTAIGIIIAIAFIAAGVFLIWRMKKDNNPDNKRVLDQQPSFDSEALESIEQVYEDISLEKRTQLEFQNEGSIYGYDTITELSVNLPSNVDLSQDQDELNRLPSIKRTLPLPTLAEERKSHLEDQNYEEIKSNACSNAEELGNTSSIMVENDIYESFNG